MVVGAKITYLSLLLMSLAAYLLINSLLIVFKELKERASIFFGVAGIFLSICLFSSVLRYEGLLVDMSTLLIFPAFYNYLKYHRKKYAIKWNLLLHLTIPTGWLMLSLSGWGQEMEGLFDFVYLLAIIGYVWAGIHGTSKLRKVAYWNVTYLKTLFIGLIVVIITRFILPIFFQNAETYMLYFHIILAAYFVLLSSFYIRVPKRNKEEQKSAIQQEEAINYEEQVKRRLRKAMNGDKAFLNPELSLNDLAAKLEMKSTELSNFINNNLGKNFNDFVNEYRVEEVKRLISSSNLDPRATIMELAYQAGFNSKPSFNRIFKQFTHMTPSEYKKSKQEILTKK